MYEVDVSQKFSALATTLSSKRRFLATMHRYLTATEGEKGKS